MSGGLNLAVDGGPLGLWSRRDRHVGAKRLPTLTASYAAKARETCQCRRRRSFALVVNLKTAKTIGLVHLRTFLVRC